MSEDKTLTRIAALLRQAEGTDNEHEADAFMQTAQRLATACSIDLAVARAHTASKQARSTPSISRVSIGAPGTKGLRTYAALFLAIGRANELKFDVASNSSYVIAYGFDPDIETTKALYASLAIQMVRASDQYIKAGDYKMELTYRRTTDWHPRPVHASTARISFQLAYTQRIGSRLIEAREAAKAQSIQAELNRNRREGDGDATTPVLTETGAIGTPSLFSPTPTPGTSSTELALRDKDVEIKDFHRANSNARGTWHGGRAASGHSDHASKAGDRAARQARLGGEQAIGGSRTAISGRVTL